MSVSKKLPYSWNQVPLDHVEYVDDLVKRLIVSSSTAVETLVKARMWHAVLNTQLKPRNIFMQNIKISLHAKNLPSCKELRKSRREDGRPEDDSSDPCEVVMVMVLGLPRRKQHRAEHRFNCC